MQHYPSPPTTPEVLLSAAAPRRDLSQDPSLRRVARGAYYRPSAQESTRRRTHELNLARCVAAVRTSRAAVALTEESAALVHGLWVIPREPDVRLGVRSWPPRPRVPLPPVVTGTSSPRTVHLHRHRLLTKEAALSVVSGLPVTSLERTALGAALRLPPERSLPIIDSAARALVRPDRFRPEQGEKEWGRLRARLLAQVEDAGPYHGSVRARAVLAAASLWSESPGETLTRLALLRTGVPPMVLQYRVRTSPNDPVYFPDLSWPEMHVAVEFDGRGKYERQADLWEERRRQQHLERLGWHVLRLSWEELSQPTALTQSVLALMPAHVVAGVRPAKGLA